MFPRFIPAYPNRTYVVVNRLRVITKLINIPCYYCLIKSPLGYVLTDIFQFAPHKQLANQVLASSERDLR